MRTPPRRRFTPLDAGLLAAATAAWIWFAAHERALTQIHSLFYARMAIWDRLHSVVANLRFLTTCLGVYPPALLLLRLRHPRPSRSRLARQPGFIACAVSTLLLAASIPLLALRSFLGPLWQNAPSRFPWYYSLYLKFTGPEHRGFHKPGTFDASPAAWFDWLWHLSGSFPIERGLAVLAAWATLALCAGWRPEPSWIDRAGRALGVYSVAVVPLIIILSYFADRGYWHVGNLPF